MSEVQRPRFDDPLGGRPWWSWQQDASDIEPWTKCEPMVELAAPRLMWPRLARQAPLIFRRMRSRLLFSV
jgi:hypothetical protein